jgi:hypothetical protein
MYSRQNKRVEKDNNKGSAYGGMLYEINKKVEKDNDKGSDYDVPTALTTF